MNQSVRETLIVLTECSIRIEDTLKKIQFAVQVVKNYYDVQSRLIPLASSIDSLPARDQIPRM